MEPVLETVLLHHKKTPKKTNFFHMSPETAEPKKRKIESNCRRFQTQWENKYFLKINPPKSDLQWSCCCYKRVCLSPLLLMEFYIFEKQFKYKATGEELRSRQIDKINTMEARQQKWKCETLQLVWTNVEQKHQDRGMEMKSKNPQAGNALHVLLKLRWYHTCQVSRYLNVFIWCIHTIMP